MSVSQKNVKHMSNYNFPSMKLRNVFCVQCRHQFFLEEFVPLKGVIPLLLECGHVTCIGCAKSMSYNQCPSCDKNVGHNNDRTSSLPLNMYALGLVMMSHNRPLNVYDVDITFNESNNSKIKQQSVKSFCYECGIQAQIKCPQCVALYCVICYSKIHGRALQNHTKVMLSEGKDENSFIVRNICSEHCNELLGYYCDNCDIAGCLHCMLRSHSEHEYQPLLKKNQSLLEELRDTLETVQKNLKGIRQAQKKLKSTVIYPTEVPKIDNAEAIITQHFAYLHGVLQNVEQKFLDTLRQHRDSQSKNIDSISTQLAEYEDRLHSALSITESISKNLDKINVQQVIRDLQDLVNIPYHLVLSDALENQNIWINIDRTIIDALKKHCTIQMPKEPTFSLHRTETLPSDYVIEPLTDEDASSVNSFDINLSEKAMGTISDNNKNSPSSSKSDSLPVVGSSETVYVSHVVDPSCFYAQLAQNKHRLMELSAQIAQHVNASGITPKEIVWNTLYIVQSSKDHLWYRARISKKTATPSYVNDRYDVTYIDYGMKEQNVPLSKIRCIVPELARYPTMALKCTLHDIVPCDSKWRPEAIKVFKDLVYSNMMASMFVMMITGNTYYVDLCVISSKDSRVISLKDTLIYMNYATCISPNKSMRMNPAATLTYYAEHLDLEKYTDVHVLFVESPNAIYVEKAHANKSYYMKMIGEMMKEYGKDASNPELVPVPYRDLACVAYGSDAHWYRALIREVTENTVTVFYVDLGYTRILNHNSIRTISKTYTTVKTQAIKLSLKNITMCPGNKDEWSQDTIDFLTKFLKDTGHFKVFPFSQSNNTYQVAMYTHKNLNVSDLLVRNNLAVYSDGQVPAGTNTRQKYRRSKFRRNIDDTQTCGEFYDNPLQTNLKNKNTEKNSDPFKIPVTIHQIQSPDCIYVSDATCDQSSIEEMMKKMQEFYSKYRSVEQDTWTKDSVCAVYLATSNMYYRAKIVDIKPENKVIVFLYDIGIEETIPMSDVQSLHSTFCKVSTYVFKIKLSGILPCGGSNTWPTLSCEILHEIINDCKNNKFYISKLEDEETEDSAVPVELWIKQTRIDGPLEPTRHEINSINRMLIEQGVALPIKEYAKKRDKILAIELKRQLMQKLERLSQSDLKVQWYEINTDFDNSLQDDITEDTSKTTTRIFLLDSNNEIYNKEEMSDNIPTLSKLPDWLPVTPISDDNFIGIPTYVDSNGFLYLHSVKQNAAMLEYIETKLKKLYTNCFIESCDTVWTIGDMCIAQYHANEKWYRGKVLNIQEDETIEVQFVDYGNIESCPIGTLKKKVILQEIPIQSTKCLIYGLVPGNECRTWATEDLDKLHGLLIEQKCDVTVIDRTESYFVVSITIFPNEYCKEKCDLLAFLTNVWKMNIEARVENTLSEESVSTTNTPSVTIDSEKPLHSETEEIKDMDTSGKSVLQLQSMDHVNVIESGSSDGDSLTLEDKVISSTPQIGSEEELEMNYKTISIPKDIEYIEIEPCCSISPIKFSARLKENVHSTVLNGYYVQYEHLMNDLQENASKQPVITSFEPNTPCCAKYDDNLWYRCLITESEPVESSNDVEIKLLYIDYGNDDYRVINTLENCELRTLKKEWFDVPIMAIKCALWNVEISPTAEYHILLSYLRKMGDKQVIAIIKDVDEKFLKVELYEDSECKEVMYHELIEQGLLRIKNEK